MNSNTDILVLINEYARLTGKEHLNPRLVINMDGSYMILEDVDDGVGDRYVKILMHGETIHNVLVEVGLYVHKVRAKVLAEKVLAAGYQENHAMLTIDLGTILEIMAGIKNYDSTALMDLSSEELQRVINDLQDKLRQDLDGSEYGIWNEVRDRVAAFLREAFPR
jgi:hypothetical protein